MIKKIGVLTSGGDARHERSYSWSGTFRAE